MTEPLVLTSEQGPIGILTLNMAHKRNALNEEAIAAIDAYFSAVPAHIRAIVLMARGEHFCAGLDLKEHHAKARSGVEFMRVCQGWHRAPHSSTPLPSEAFSLFPRVHSLSWFIPPSVYPPFLLPFLLLLIFLLLMFHK